MAKLCYGRRSPYFSFQSESDFFECYGFICNMQAHGIEISWEYNDACGAWAGEGRIHFFARQNGRAYTPMPRTLQNRLTAGRGGSIIARLNCNDYIEELKRNYGFSPISTGNGVSPQNLYPPNHPEDYVPEEYLDDFYRGYNL